MKARLHRPGLAALRQLARALRDGELVAIPTETVYGLAAAALDAHACRKIFRAKGRPARDPLIVHVSDLAHAELLAEFNEPARRVARRFWPGPLTLVLPKKEVIPAVVTSGGPTVALRAPAHPVARKLLRLAGVPLAAPSANRFGYVSPTTAEHVRDGLGSRIGHILDGGPCALGVESTILDLSHPARPRILRPGAVTAAQLEKILRRPVITIRPKTRRGISWLAAPGLLTRHYSPRTPLRWRTDSHRPRAGQTAAASVRALPAGHAEILWRKPRGAAGPRTFWFSERGALAEVARNLYDVLRRADAGGFRKIWVEPLPAGAGGLADAIRDRLERAVARRQIDWKNLAPPRGAKIARLRSR